MTIHHPDAPEQLVSVAMQELARTPTDEAPLPDPSFIWWKAQRLRRLEAEREATAPLEIGERIHAGVAVLAAVALAAAVWDRVPLLALAPATLLTLALGLVVLLSVFAAAAIDAIREDNME